MHMSHVCLSAYQSVLRRTTEISLNRFIVPPRLSRLLSHRVAIDLGSEYCVQSTLH